MHLDGSSRGGFVESREDLPAGLAAFLPGDAGEWGEKCDEGGDGSAGLELIVDMQDISLKLKELLRTNPGVVIWTPGALRQSMYRM